MGAFGIGGIFDDNEIQDGVRQVIRGLGFNSENGELANTPRRIAKYLKNSLRGYKQNTAQILSVQFENKYYKDNFVLLKDIHFRSTCEHHFLPIIGKVSIAYFPKDKIVGIGKLARLVDAFALRLQLQEKMTFEIGNEIDKYIENDGVAVFVAAEHFCMKVAGAEKQGSSMETFFFSGNFKKPDIKNDFLSSVK